MVILGGILLHKIGHKKCLVIYSSLINLGIITFVTGALYFESFDIMYLGRVIGGMGAENLMITQYYCTTLWCGIGQGRGLAFALALSQSFSFLASIIGFYAFPHMYLESGTIKYPLFVALIAPLLSFCCVAGYLVISGKRGMGTFGFEESRIDRESGKWALSFLTKRA